MALDGIYRERILKASKDPRNQEGIEAATCSEEGHNALCGDRLEVTLRLEDGRIEALGLKVRGCAIFNASASMMRDSIEGSQLEESFALARDLVDAIAGKDIVLPENLQPLLSLIKHRTRHRCATLPWETLLVCGDDS